MNFGVNKGRAGELLALIDEALADGADITLDTYPYLLEVPPRCRGAAQLERVRWHRGHHRAVAGPGHPRPDPAGARGGRLHGCHAVAEWETLEISGVQNPDQTTWSARLSSRSPSGESEFDTFCDILIRDRCGTGILQHVGHEENVRQIMVHRVHTGGSDGLLVGGKPHPRAWGTFPRVPGPLLPRARPARPGGDRPSPDRTARRPAQPGRPRPDQAGLRRRPGAVRSGHDRRHRHLSEPRQPAAGIHHVFVDRRAGRRRRPAHRARAGRALRRPPGAPRRSAPEPRPSQRTHPPITEGDRWTPFHLLLGHGWPS